MVKSYETITIQVNIRFQSLEPYFLNFSLEKKNIKYTK